MKTLRTWMAAAAMMALAGTAPAALVSLGDGTVKDTSTNLIWLEDWNLNGIGDGWSDQKTWANNLSFAGSSDWALPEIGEYAALFSAYGNLTLVSQFSNVQSIYWSGTAIPTPFNAWSFQTVDGVQVGQIFGSGLYAVAVRRGDVVSVPEPQALALALLALGAMVVARRRRQP